MPVQVLVHAYDYPTMASKHEQAIGAHMLRLHKAELNKRATLSPIATPELKPSENGKTRSSILKAARALEIMLDLEPLPKRSINAALVAKGLSISRNSLDNMLSEMQQQGLVDFVKRKSVSHWYVSDKDAAVIEIKEAKRFR